MKASHFIMSTSNQYFHLTQASPSLDSSPIEDSSPPPNLFVPLSSDNLFLSWMNGLLQNFLILHNFGPEGNWDFLPFESIEKLTDKKDEIPEIIKEKNIRQYQDFSMNIIGKLWISTKGTKLEGKIERIKWKDLFKVHKAWRTGRIHQDESEFEYHCNRPCCVEFRKQEIQILRHRISHCDEDPPDLFAVYDITFASTGDICFHHSRRISISFPIPKIHCFKDTLECLFLRKIAKRVAKQEKRNITQITMKMIEENQELKTFILEGEEFLKKTYEKRRIRKDAWIQEMKWIQKNENIEK